MKTVPAVLLLAALGVAAAWAQTTSQSADDQRFFNLEDAVQHPEVLSGSELAVLAGDDLMRKELNQGPAGSDLSQEGLAAAVVHLCGAGERDLVVMGNGETFAGANVGPFWIIRDLPAGPAVVLSEVSLSLTIEGKRSNKCLSVEAFAATEAEGTTTDFSFNGDKYIVSKQKSAKLGR